jgi:hypothetical protein
MTTLRKATASGTVKRIREEFVFIQRFSHDFSIVIVSGVATNLR